MIERLTFEGNFCDIAQCDVIQGGSSCESGSCTQRKVWERLKAYEDTGLTPERCAEFARADAEGRYIVMRDAEQEGVARLRELAEANKNGRLAVLPCKVGQRVFALLDTDKHISECEVKQIGMGNKIGFIGLEPIGARGREYGVALNGFGKTVFLTREEAKKALEAMKNGN